jgi:hypothetical protein
VFFRHAVYHPAAHEGLIEAGIRDRLIAMGREWVKPPLDS